MESKRNLVVMKHENRRIRFDVGNEDTIITGAIGRTTKQAVASVAVAREFCGELMERDWERDETIESELQEAEVPK
jgi:hypothetical protein